MTVDELAKLIDQRDRLEKELKDVRHAIQQTRAATGIYATNDGRLVRVSGASADTSLDHIYGIAYIATELKLVD